MKGHCEHWLSVKTVRDAAVKKGQFPESYGSWRFAEERRGRLCNVQVGVRPGVLRGDEGKQHLDRLDAPEGEAQAVQVSGET